MVVIALVSGAWAGAYEVLRARDGADCAAVGTGDAARDELLALAESDVQPSYVPMRAAGCLLSGFATDPLVVEHARAWVTEKRWAGLGLLVANRIDAFAVEDAVSVARAAVAGESRERLLPRIARSERDPVRAVAIGVDGSGGGR